MEYLGPAENLQNVEYITSLGTILSADGEKIVIPVIREDSRDPNLFDFSQHAQYIPIPATAIQQPVETLQVHSTRCSTHIGKSVCLHHINANF